jgi:hypothetical protein
MNSTGKIVQLVNPTNNQDAATKSYVDTKFITVPTPTNTQDAANKGYVDTSIPIGGIIMWSGTISSIPSSWRLCDGSNGTPDLRNRFIIGATTDAITLYTGGSGGITRAHSNIEGTNYVTGGTKDAVVVSHGHSITDPGHQHNFAYKGGSGATWTISPPPDPWSGVGGATQERLTTSSGTGISIKSEGESGTNKNLPPYYALAFIMRIS